MKKFAPFALLLSVLTALLIGTASNANATVTTGSYECAHQSSLVIVCTDDVNVLNPDVKIEVDRTLNNLELIEIKDVLNNLDVDVNNLVNIKDALNVIGGDFDPVVIISKVCVSVLTWICTV